MNKYLKYSLFAVGGIVLFLGAFVGVAALTGAPMNEVAVIGALFDEPEQGEEEQEVASETEDDTQDAAKRGHDALQRQAGLLGAFQVDSPYTGSELRKLQNEMKSKFRETRDLADSLRARELLLDEREKAVLKKYNELNDFRTKLEEMESSIALRLSELERDEAAEQSRNIEGLKDSAALYQGGDAKTNAAMLADEAPEDAAVILKELGPEIAGEILREVQPMERRREFMAAYRKVHEAR